MSRGALVAVVLAVGGIGSLLAWQAPRSFRARAEAPAHKVANAQPIASSGGIRVDPRVGQLVTQSALLSARVERLEVDEQVPSIESAQPETERTGVDPAVEDYRRILEAHEAEVVDPLWASSARATLRTDLTTIADEIEDMRVVDVECRKQSCIAHLELSSAVRAQAEMDRLVTHIYGLSCATRVQLEGAVDPEAPYLLELVFHDCVEPQASAL